MASLLRRRLAIAALVIVSVATVRPAIAQNPPVAPLPEGTPAPPPEGAAAPPPAAPAMPAWPPPGTAPAVPPPPEPVPATPPAFVVTDRPPASAPYDMVHRTRRGWAIAGAVTFGVSWGIAGLVSWALVGSKNGDNTDACSGNCRNFAEVLWIPVAGPIIGDIRYPGSEARGPLIFWSVTQAVGVAMLVYGFVGHDVPKLRRVAEGGPTLQLLPMLARDEGGMTLTARW